MERSLKTFLSGVTLAFATFTTMVVSAQLPERAGPGLRIEVKIHFPYDQAVVDSTYMTNRVNLRQVDSLLRDSSYIATLSKVEITAQSSPEGAVGYNRRLSERRRESLKSYFTTNYPEIDTTLWSFNSVAENWDLFHHNLLNDKDLPHRDEVLKISSGTRELDAKEWLLKCLNNGEAWSYIKEHILPAQRLGAGIVFVPLQHTPIAQPYEITSPLPYPVANPYSRYTHEERKPILAIKTNLLYDLITAANLEIEVPIKERFSVTGEWINPWWHSTPSKYTMRVHMATLGVKYWLGDRSDREVLTGWAVGLNGGYAAKYDLQILSDRGVQGSYFMCGATIGYAHTIFNNNWRLEYQLGLGVTRTSYKNYTMAYDTKYGDIKVFDYPWETKRRDILGPTQLRVSLAYMIFRTKTIER